MFASQSHHYELCLRHHWLESVCKFQNYAIFDIYVCWGLLFNFLGRNLFLLGQRTTITYPKLLLYVFFVLTPSLVKYSLNQTRVYSIFVYFFNVKILRLKQIYLKLSIHKNPFRLTIFEKTYFRYVNVNSSLYDFMMWQNKFFKDLKKILGRNFVILDFLLDFLINILCPLLYDFDYSII